MVILGLSTGYLRVTHPFAMEKQALPFDLHVLGMPPALILSQDQTLQKIYFLFFSLILLLNSFKNCIVCLTLRLFRHIQFSKTQLLRFNEACSISIPLEKCDVNNNFIVFLIVSVNNIFS